MTIPKVVEALLSSAEKKGEALKRIRENQIIGRSKTSTVFVNQWKVKIKADILVVEHYDTKIAEIDLAKKKLLYYYGQSQTDAMILNGLCKKYGLNETFGYMKKEKKFIKK